MRYILCFLTISLLLVSCASKRYTKRAVEFEAAGYYEKAAEMYYLAVSRNANNVDAQVGLRKAGQVTLDNMLDKFKEQYNNSNDKDAVYLYLDAQKYFSNLKAIKCTLEFPVEYNEFFSESKKNYLESLYQKSLVLMNEEQFEQAEKTLNEISSIDKNYFNVEEMRKEARFEPIYRKGKAYLENEKYRKAYYSFYEITTEAPGFKDALSLKDEALQKAIYTISLHELVNNTPARGEENSIANIVYKTVSESNSPFMKIISNQMLGSVKQEQANAANNDNSNIKLGQTAVVKGLLSVTIEKYTINTPKLKVENKKGYFKQIIPQGEGVPPKVQYHKTEYKEYSQSIEVSCRVSFKLVSVETGTLVISDVINKTVSDNIHYAEYSGDTKMLVPGYWKHSDKESPEDVVKDNKADAMHLQQLLKSSKELKPLSVLKSDINVAVGTYIANKVMSYDPEKN